jgi:ATP-binding cassette subfamily F protein 3
LALAILARDGANFLLLDEPTNHLDIASQEVLQAVLEQFDGTVLMVSHDRYLIDQLATQIWHVDQAHLQVFKGTYSAYLEQAPRAEKRAFSTPRPTRPRPSAEIAKLEAQIHSLESSLRELGQLIERAKKSADLALLGQQYAQTEAQLAQLMTQWADLAAEPEVIGD